MGITLPPVGTAVSFDTGFSPSLGWDRLPSATCAGRDNATNYRHQRAIVWPGFAICSDIRPIPAASSTTSASMVSNSTRGSTPIKGLARLLQPTDDRRGGDSRGRLGKNYEIGHARPRST